MPENLTTGSTHKFRLNAKKDGVTWDLTGATVTLYLFEPGASTGVMKSATVTDAANGIADYTLATTDLDEVGTWQRQWRVVQGGVDIWGTRENFHVNRGA